MMTIPRFKAGGRPAAAAQARRGSAMIAVVILLVILQFAVVGAVVASSRDQDVSVHRLSAARSLYAAEGVANMAIREIGVNADEDGDGGIGSVSAPAGVGDPAIGGGSASATVTVSGDTSTVVVDGIAGASGREIRLTVRRTAASSGAGAGLYTEIWVRSSAISQLSNIPWTSTPTAVSVLPNVDLPTIANAARWSGGPISRYGVRMTGTLKVPAAGNWTFYTRSDDGSALYINGTMVVNNDGLHSATTRSGIINLPAGDAAFELRFFENTGTSVLQAMWSGPGVSTQTIIPDSAFTCDSTYPMPPIAAEGAVALVGDNAANKTWVDAFDSSQGGYGGSNVITDAWVLSTNSTSAGALSASGKATVRGNALVGPGGSAGSVIALSSGGTITGTSSASAVEFVAMAMGLPSGLPATQGNIVLASSQTMTSGTRRYNNLTIQNNSTVITISGANVWVIDGDFAMRNTSKIQIGAGATLTIYCAGDMTFSDNSESNVNTGVPSNLTIYMRGASKSVAINDTAQVYANVWNPFGAMTLTGNKTSDFYGRFAGNTLTLNARSCIHGDIPAGGPGGSGGGSGSGAQTRVLEWSYQP